MNFQPNNIYHVYNQGNNRQRIFYRDDNYLLFLNLYEKLVAPFASTIAWCLMPNHFHFMLYTDTRCAIKIKQGGIMIDPIANGIRKLLSGYARILNSQNQKSGSVFRQKTKSKRLSQTELSPGQPYHHNDYFVNCFHYIHQNPLTAKLVSRLEDWDYSSFRDYAGLRNGTLCQKELAVKYCGYNPALFINHSYELVDKKLIPFFR